MLPRRVALLVLPAFAAAPRPGGATQVDLPPAPRHCGDPGGRFIACEALQSALPPAPPRCPLCGGRHRAGDAP
ncbi:hypothetical protein J5Y09_03440 [Roseomonas sp. PWR1]|uniref:Uncharacterized protein n=1 Tax=Roseomonas nitratireducens TaxID=2820810 RepID=A0ABS4ANL3_9PROT|nr:hypothetical protein [Neoroseomonas nitratireducens]MBP0462953.1 hypothetical protein [Neoroseomonas nitratireducens]